MVYALRYLTRLPGGGVKGGTTDWSSSQSFIQEGPKQMNPSWTVTRKTQELKKVPEVYHLSTKR